MTSTLTQQTDEPVAEPIVPPFWVKRVQIEGYKSFAYCDVTLEPFTVLVGRNGTGKSNFLSALALLGEVPTTDVRELFGGRRSIDEVLCRTINADRFSLGVDLQVLDRRTSRTYDVWYQVAVAGKRKNWSDRFEENLRLVDRASGRELGFIARGGQVSWSGDVASLSYRPAQLPNSYRFLLGYLGEGPLLAVNEGLSGMAFYNFHPDSMRLPQPRGESTRLHRDGSNLPAVIASLEELDPERLEWAQIYLQAIVPEVARFRRTSCGDYETVQFDVRRSSGEPISFTAASMSDGTLRATAALLAVFQTAMPVGAPMVVGIEEPELVVHPAAIRAVLDALDAVTGYAQVIITTHSTELLAEESEVKPAQVRVVRMVDGRTEIAPVDAASLEIIHHEWSSLAELHREGHLLPDPIDVERQHRS